MKKVFIIMGHPTKESFNGKLADAYEKKLIALGYDVRRQNLIDLNFNLISTLKNAKTLEPDLINAQNNIKWADELVFFYPLWWGNVPALLKGYIDRVFIPGFAYKYHENDHFWDKLLKNKTARVYSTCDAPAFYSTLAYKNCDFTFIKNAVCGFTGIKVKMLKRIGSLHRKSINQRNKIIAKIISKIK